MSEGSPSLHQGPYSGDNGRGCWLWTGFANTKGYGYAKVAGRMARVHRAVFEAVTGQSPPVVRHTCNDPLCFRPDHLLGGTHQDNVNDRNAAGRQARGEAIHTAKLTEAQAREIRASRSAPRELAEWYQVSRATINDIQAGRTWL